MAAADDLWSKLKCEVCGESTWTTYEVKGYGPSGQQTLVPGRGSPGNLTRYECTTCGNVKLRKEE